MKNIADIKKEFYFSVKELKDLSKVFLEQMFAGLQGKKSSLSMISSYTDIADRKKKGKFMAFDLGGSNFRVMIVELLGKGKTREIFSYKLTIPKKCMDKDQQTLFGFIAQAVKHALDKAKIKKTENIEAGFTFSFPVKQKGVDSGYLLKWTKGFKVKGVKGHNIVELMNKALIKKGVKNIHVNALVNDTVGTQVAQSYKDNKSTMGIILGTGNNACYREAAENIRPVNKKGYTKDHMIINIEWGQFHKVRRTIYDKRVDKRTPNPGHQYLEKMVSGMYLGEIYREVLQDMVKKGCLLKKQYSKKLQEPYVIVSAQVSDIEKDKTRTLSKISHILEEIGIKDHTIKDRESMQKIAEMISSRAADIVAMGIASVIKKTDIKIKNKHTVAIDGSVFEKYYRFPDKIKQGLKRIVKGKAKNIRLALSKDGSGKGAAIISSSVKE